MPILEMVEENVKAVPATAVDGVGAEAVRLGKEEDDTVKVALPVSPKRMGLVLLEPETVAPVSLILSVVFVSRRLRILNVYVPEVVGAVKLKLKSRTSPV